MKQVIVAGHSSIGENRTKKPVAESGAVLIEPQEKH